MARLDFGDATLLGDDPSAVTHADVAQGNGVLVVRGGEQAGLRFALLDRVLDVLGLFLVLDALPDVVRPDEDLGGRDAAEPVGARH